MSMVILSPQPQRDMNQKDEIYMNKIKKLIALTAVMALFGSQLQGQDCAPPCCAAPCQEDCAAYCDGGRASYYSAAIPLGALAIAAVIIATTDNHHHRSSSSNNNNSSNSYSHCHCH